MARDIPIQVVVNGKDNSKGIISGFGKALGGISTIAFGVMAALGVQGLTNTALGLGKSMLKSAADMEQQEIAFKTLLGSAEKADEAIARIKKDAKATPFELPGLIDMNKRLISAGIGANDAADLVLNLGDAISATGGTGVELDRLVANFQQIQSVGKASLMDIRQFGNAGIPIFDLLADSLGKTKAEIGEMVTEGEIGFDELTGAFDGASGAGGRFENAMADQSKTFSGVMSNISDSLGIMGEEIFRDSGLFDLFKGSAEGLLGFIESKKDVIKDFGQGFKLFSEVVIKGNDDLDELREGTGKFGKNKTLIDFLFKIRHGFEKISDTAGKVIGAFKNIFKGIGESAGKIADDPLFKAMIENFKLIGQGLGLMINSFKDVVIESWPIIKDAFIELKDTVTSMFQTSNKDGGTFMDTMKKLGTFLAKVLVGAITGLIKAVKFYLDVQIAVIKKVREVREAFKSSWVSIKETGEKIRGFYKKISDSVVDFVKNIILKYLEMSKAFRDKKREIKENIVGAFTNAINGVKAKFVHVKEFILEKIRDIRDKIKSFFSAGADIAGGLSGAFKTLINSLVNRINRALEFRIEVGGVGVDINAPDIPHLAEGGVVKARSGGTLALIGEGGKDEAVIPLDEGGRAGVGGVTVNVFGDVFGIEDLAGKVIDAMQMKAKSNGMATTEFIDIKL